MINFSLASKNYLARRSMTSDELSAGLIEETKRLRGANGQVEQKPDDIQVKTNQHAQQQGASL
jgi:hypothetical protein